MKRLIKRSPGKWQLDGVSWQQLEPEEVITKEIYQKLYMDLCKLKDYENTGLNPDQVESLKDLSSVCVTGD